MKGDQILALLKAKGATMTAVAEAAGVTVMSVSRVVRSESKSRRIASIIALFLGKRVDDLWPGQYPEKYSRRPSERITRELQAAALSVDNQRAA